MVEEDVQPFIIDNSQQRLDTVQEVQREGNVIDRFFDALIGRLDRNRENRNKVSTEAGSWPAI